MSGIKLGLYVRKSGKGERARLISATADGLFLQYQCTGGEDVGLQTCNANWFFECYEMLRQAISEGVSDE